MNSRCVYAACASGSTGAPDHRSVSQQRLPVSCVEVNKGRHLKELSRVGGMQRVDVFNVATVDIALGTMLRAPARMTHYLPNLRGYRLMKDKRTESTGGNLVQKQDNELRSISVISERSRAHRLGDASVNFTNRLLALQKSRLAFSSTFIFKPGIFPVDPCERSQVQPIDAGLSTIPRKQVLAARAQFARTGKL